MLEGKIVLNFQASCAVFPGQEYFLYVSTLGIGSNAPVRVLMAQAVGLALRLRVMEMFASVGDCESPCTKAARVLLMNPWTEGSRSSSISNVWMVVGSAIAMEVRRGGAGVKGPRVDATPFYLWTTWAQRAYKALSISIHVFIMYLKNSDYYQ